jgi:hypothetical protein
MELAHSTIQQNYIKQIRALEAKIEKATEGDLDQDLLDDAQDKLDALAKKYQDNEKTSSAVYKLYELQAAIHYFNGNDADALDFINQATETRGSNYPRAEKLKAQLHQHSNKDGSSGSHINGEPPLQLQTLTRGLRTSAIIMTIISVISVYFIPWAVFYIILATKLKPEKVPNRKLVKGAAIATLPLCLGIIPIIIDIEFWRMNKRLKEYEEKGSKAFISDKEYKAGEPKRKKHRIIAWTILLSIIAIIVVLIIVAVASNSSTPTSNSGSTPDNKTSVAYEKMESLRSQYDTCDSDLEARRDSVDIYNDYEVDSFNSDLEDCEDKRLKLNRAVDEYNQLAGLE